MNGFNQFPATNGSSSTPSSQHRNSMDMMQNGSRVHSESNGALPVPVGGAQRPFGAIPGDKHGFGAMGMPRSPPKNKNTQHVPCKFFLQGTCQAGRTCPFSHDVESTTRPAPCKYFAKGGCKFGRKCALLHVAPDGTVLNRGPAFPPGPQYAPLQPQPGQFGQAPAPGLLSMQAQSLEPRLNGDIPHEFDHYQYGPRNGYDLPQIDMTYASASPQYGSPPQDNRFAGSPPGQGLSVLDAPLPNSFDSNGISMAARNGPFAASVPSRFGVDSPPSSLPRKAQLGNTALRDLHNSAFGDRGMDGVLAGSSPPSGPDEPLTFPKRSLHSDRLRAPRQQMISASLGTKLPTQSFEYSDEDDGDTDREEDLLPASLHDLIPEGRTRESRSRTGSENTPASFLAAQRRTISGQGTPQETKVGSPYSSSPSRFIGMFSRGQPGRSDAEGHVGSPLRRDGSYFGSQSTRANGDLSPTVSSPPRQASMSMLTQELQRTKLDNKLDAARSQAAAAVGMTRSVSNGSASRTSLDRALSSASVGRERIEEEQDLFDMDEIGDPSRTAPRIISNSNERNAGAWSGKSFGSPPGQPEPSFGAIGGHRAAK